jgi:hypothetical protein
MMSDTRAVQVLAVKEYNQVQHAMWKRASEDTHYPDNPVSPVGAYCFLDKDGNLAEEGFVAHDETGAIWKPTKIGAMRCFKRRHL